MKAWMVIDGMWGSCGKGSLAGRLAVERRPDVVVCNFGPNAGHTYVDRDGRVRMTQQLPTGLVSPGLRHLLLGPGAVVDPAILAAELAAFPEAVEALSIHENAAVVVSADKHAEEVLREIGSTRKGTAAAYCRKVMRATSEHPRRASECEALRPYVVTAKQYDKVINLAHKVQVESAQGVELSLSRGHFYPFCTGRNVTPEAVLDDCGVPMRFLGETCLVLRTYPIRVGDEFIEQASGPVKVGTSGPVYQDMEELTWSQVSTEAGIPGLLERTTVTKKVRRVFRFSDQQALHAFWVTGPASIFVNFCNYLDPKATHLEVANEKARGFVEHIGNLASQAWGTRDSVCWLGWGPAHGDVEDLYPGRR